MFKSLNKSKAPRGASLFPPFPPNHPPKPRPLPKLRPPPFTGLKGRAGPCGTKTAMASVHMSASVHVLACPFVERISHSTTRKRSRISWESHLRVGGVLLSAPRPPGDRCVMAENNGAVGRLTNESR